VFVPYAAWSVVYWALPFITGRADVIQALERLPRELILGTAAYHLWFPPVLLLVYALTPVARVVRRRSPELLAGGVLAAAFLIALAAPALRLPADVDHLVDGFAAFVPFAAAGAWYAERERLAPARLLVPAGIAGAMLLLAESFGLPAVPSILTVLATAAALALAVRLLATVPESQALPLQRAATLSFGVYLAHPLVLAVVREPLARAGLSGLWRSPAFTLAAYVAILGVALAFASGLKRRPALSWLA
jgi:surface polysaccharide O-acyltransferase-like enzyme